MSEVKKNDTVKVHYTGKLKDGKVFDTSEGKDPLEFVVGEGRLIKDFEEAVIGLKQDESKTITIEAANAYGPKRKDLVFKVENDKLPKDITPAVGMKLVSEDPDGRKNVVTITEIADDHILIDTNHPLAGEDLTFEIKVVEIV